MSAKEAIHIFFKIGDHHQDDRGRKDGEPVYWQPATGEDCFGQPRYIGPGDKKDFVVVWALSTEEEIQELFKMPRKNSNAYKKGRKTNYYLDLEKVFTAKGVKDYRDHDKEMVPHPVFDLMADLSDYRINRKRLEKDFVSGSISSGNYDIGSGGDYSNVYLFEQAIAGDVGDGELIGTLISNNDVGANVISLSSHVTSSIGSITITSDNAGSGMGGYQISNTDANFKRVYIGIGGNYNIGDVIFNKFLFDYTAGTGERVCRIRNTVIDGSSSADTATPWLYIDAAGFGGPEDPGELYFYNNIIITPHKTGGIEGDPVELDMTGYTDVNFNNFVHFENCSFFIDSTVSGMQALRFENAPAGQTYQGFKNLVCHGIDTATVGMVEIRTASTVQLDYPAYDGSNYTQSGGAVTETGKITSEDADFLSLDTGNEEFGYIDAGSGLYASGGDGLAENINDIINAIWPPAPADMSRGPFSGFVPPPLDMDPNPEVYYENHLAGDGVTITATSELTGFPIENITLEALLYDWQATSTADQTLTADCGSAVTVSRVLLAGNFIDLTDVGIKISYSTNGSSWETLAFTTQLTSGPVLLSVTETTARYWRIKLSGLTTAPVIGHWGLYDPLIAPRLLGDGSDLYRAKDNSVTHTTETGRDQMHIGPIMREGRLLLGNILEGDDVADKVDELRELGRTGKMFICLNPEESPEDVFYALLTRSITDPIVGQTRSPRLDYREVI